MRHFHTLKILPFLFILFTGQVSAEANYAGFSIGWSAADEECDYFGYNCDGTDTSFKVFAGRRMHENVALEISYQDLGRLNDRSDTLTTTAKSEGLNVSVLGIIPVSEGIDLFGKMGWMSWDTRYTRIGTITETSSDDGTDFTFGAGMSFTLQEKYHLRFEFERLNELGDEFTAGGSNITVWSFGGGINF